MDEMNTLLSTCAFSIFISLLVMVVAINLAYMGRRWINGVRGMGE
jgi:hypothetical protein